jgi:methionine synthase II (cobalamin-independent)
LADPIEECAQVMADYDPRTDTGIPTEPVGSLPRPATLQEAYARYDAGEISKEELAEQQDAAAKESIERFEATGSPIISDGEQRRSSFATYPIADTLAGTGLAPGLAPGGQFFAIFADGHGRQLPKLERGPFRYNQYAADSLRKSIPYATKPMKQAVIAPSMLALLYPLKDPVEGYSREEFEAALVDECEKDIREAFAAGAARVSVDFTEGRLATREDPRNPWTGAGLLPHFIELNNRVMARFSAEERRNIGVHTCPGGDRDSTHSADVDYADLLPALFELNVGNFYVALAGEPDRERVLKMIREHLKPGQQVFVGVVAPIDPRVETPEEVRDRVLEAARYVPVDQLGTTDDCGFAPFCDDTSTTRDTAFAKVRARVAGTALAAQLLGGG